MTKKRLQFHINEGNDLLLLLKRKKIESLKTNDKREGKEKKTVLPSLNSLKFNEHIMIHYT